MTSTDRAALLDLAAYGPRAVLCTRDRELVASTIERSIAGAVATMRAQGIAAGDRVAVLGATAPATVVAMLAALQCGAIVVPLNPRYREAELAHVVYDSGARLALVDDALAQRLAAAVPGLSRISLASLPQAEPEIRAPLDDDAVAILVYTSGTTGPSKGVGLSMRALVSQARALADAWAIDSTDVLVLALPLFHVHGLCVALFTALLQRATIRLHERFDPAWIVADFVDRGATVFMGVPTMYVQLVEHLDRTPSDAAALAHGRLFTAGSAALAPRVLERFAALTGQRILERYGMTETLVTLSNPLASERRAGTVGLALPGATIRIVDEHDGEVRPGEPGELLVRAPWLMTGYWNGDARRADDWFRTGDVASVDVDGYVAIVGRTSTDIVKTGGFKVATREIEDAIAELPDVLEVAVLGIPDERWGERIVAAVVARTPEARPTLPTSVAAHVRARLADYKVPKDVHVVDALPRNAMGKVEKTRLRALWSP